MKKESDIIITEMERDYKVAFWIAFPFCFFVFFFCLFVGWASANTYEITPEYQTTWGYIPPYNSGTCNTWYKVVNGLCGNYWNEYADSGYVDIKMGYPATYQHYDFRTMANYDVYDYLGQIASATIRIYSNGGLDNNTPKMEIGTFAMSIYGIAPFVAADWLECSDYLISSTTPDIIEWGNNQWVDIPLSEYYVNQLSFGDGSANICLRDLTYSYYGATPRTDENYFYSDIGTNPIKLILEDFGEVVYPDPGITIIDQQPFCEDQDAIFTIDVPASADSFYYDLYFNFIGGDSYFEGSRALNSLNSGIAFATTTNDWGSSSLHLYAQIIDPSDQVIKTFDEYFDVYASSSLQCGGLYGSEYQDFCSDICSDLATSTFGGDIACGARRVACWAFAPSSKSQLYFQQSWNRLKNSFPFSLYFDITDALSGLSTSTTDQIGLAMPILRMDENGRATLTAEMVIDASTTEDIIGTQTFDLVKLSISALLWVLVALYILKRIHRK